MAIHIGPILNDLGVRSALELFRKTGSPERSLRRQAQIASIGSLYLRLGGSIGVLGFPISDVDFSGSVPIREFAGGKIECFENGPQCEAQWEVNIAYLGFHCNEESDWDQGTSWTSLILFSEFYGAEAEPRPARTPEYNDVNGGENRFDLMTIISKVGPPPVGLIVLGAEHDWGTPGEAEAKLLRTDLKTSKRNSKVRGRPLGLHGRRRTERIAM